MNNISKYKVILIAIYLALAIPFAINAAPVNGSIGNTDHAVNHCEKHRPPFEEDMSMGLPPHLKDLALSDAQQDKIFSLTYPLMPQMRDQMKQRHQFLGELLKLGNTESFDEAKAKQIVDKLVSIEKDAMLNRARIDSKIFSILTSEQRSKLSEIQNKMSEEPPPPEAAHFEQHRNGRYYDVGA